MHANPPYSLCPSKWKQFAIARAKIPAMPVLRRTPKRAVAEMGTTLAVSVSATTIFLGTRASVMTRPRSGPTATLMVNHNLAELPHEVDITVSELT